MATNIFVYITERKYYKYIIVNVRGIPNIKEDCDYQDMYKAHRRTSVQLNFIEAKER